MFESLSVRIEGAIGELRLERPEKLNPLSIEMLEEIVRAARYFDEARGVKVVVVRGSGASFSSGADLASFGKVEGRTTREVAELGRAMADSLEAMRAISIAAIRGWCIGGGMVLASACDLRIASEGARFSIPEVDLGIPLAWGGIPRLVRELGPARTKELVLTCRPFRPRRRGPRASSTGSSPDDQLDLEVADLAGSLVEEGVACPLLDQAPRQCGDGSDGRDDASVVRRGRARDGFRGRRVHGGAARIPSLAHGGRP